MSLNVVVPIAHHSSAASPSALRELHVNQVLFELVLRVLVPPHQNVSCTRFEDGRRPLEIFFVQFSTCRVSLLTTTTLTDVVDVDERHSVALGHTLLPAHEYRLLFVAQSVQNILKRVQNNNTALKLNNQLFDLSLEGC
ncbi:sodium/glutamate symporter [Pseudomonas phage SRT6]|nr:sodium/glutamate symporter [Pseudomonas phage SRT6]